jgi:hypothetical protein
MQWSGHSAGGCPNQAATFGNNPKYTFQGPGSDSTHTPCLIKIEGEAAALSVNSYSVSPRFTGPRQYSVGFLVEGSDGSKT